MTSTPRVERMPRETVVELIESGPPELAEHVSEVKKGLQNIPWLSEDTIDWEGGHKARVLAQCPELFTIWWLEDFHAVKNGSVDTLTKELLGMFVADEIGCTSCVPYHAGAARHEGASDELITKIRNFDEQKDELPDDLRHVLEFGHKSVYTPTEVTDEDVDRLKAIGYTDGEIVEITICAFLAFRHAAINQVLNLGRE